MSFDAIAPWYRSLEWIAFGDALQRSRVACLREIPAPRRALIVGEGNGRFLCELLRLHPEVEVDCVDASDRMLQLARARVKTQRGDGGESVTFLCRDITSWNPPEHHYDLLVTHFVLDCFVEADLAAAIGKLGLAATKDAHWLLADFCVPARGVSRLWARAWLTVMYRFFRITAGIRANELVDFSSLIRAQGFVLRRQHLFRHGMLKSELWG